MTLARTKTWAFGEKLTSDQINALDTNVINALDKRFGMTDTLASDITVTGATVFSGATTFNSSINVTGAITTSNTFTTTAGMVFNSGNTVTGNMHLAGIETVDSGGSIVVASGGSLTTASGSTVTLNSPSIVAPTFSGAITNSGTITGGGAAGVAITGGTIDSAAITGGTIESAGIDSAAITNGTIAGATITGGSVGANSGIATLDSAGKLTSAQASNAIVGSYYYRMTTGLKTLAGSSSSVFNYLPGAVPSLGIPAQAGDVLMIDAHFVFTNTDYVRGQVSILEDATDHTTTDVVLGTPNVINCMDLHLKYIVQTTCTVTLVEKFAVNSSTATFYDSTSANGACALRVLQYRP